MRFLISLVMLLPLCAQPPQEGQKKGGGRAPEPPKNLKILKPEEVRATMRSFTQALGVQCTFCHVQGDFASDENPKKNIARMMINMAHDVNAKFPDGAEKMHVTCYTCHRGKTEPETAPPPAQ
ncbi:MAG: c-type cytochrome [Bryobacteraceae bacterium]